MKPDKAWFCIVVGAVFMTLAVVGFVFTDDLTAVSGRGALRGPSWLIYPTGFVLGGVGVGLGIHALIAWKRR